MQVPQFLDSNSDRLDQISLSGQEKWAVESRRAGTMYYGCRETSGNFISRQKSGEFWRLWKIYKKTKNFGKFTCETYWRFDEELLKSQSKSENFRHFWQFSHNQRPQTKLLLFFWYTVNPRKLFNAIFKKIWTKKFRSKSLNPPSSNLMFRQYPTNPFDS